MSSATYIDSTIGGGVILAHSRNATIGSHTVLANGDKLGSIFFEGSDGTDFERGAQIEAFVDGTPGDNDMPGRLVFSTTPDGSVTPAERVRIDSSGRLLVGTTSANQNNKIHARLVDGSIANTSNQSVIFAENNTNAWITIGSGASNYGGILFADSGSSDIGQVRYNHSTNGFEFITNSSEKLRIDTDGRVMIGDTDVDNSWSGGDSVVIGNTSSGTRTGVTLVSANDQDGGIYFSDGTSSGSANVQGQIVYNHAGSYLALYTVAGERLRITSGGDVLIADTSNSIYNDSSGGGMNLKANGQLVLKKEASSTADPLVWLNDTGQTTNKFIVFAQDGTERANIGLADKTVSIISTANNSIATKITNNGQTGGHCLKLTTGGTGAGTHTFSVFRNNQSSEEEVFRIDGAGDKFMDAVFNKTANNQRKSYFTATGQLIMGRNAHEHYIIFQDVSNNQIGGIVRGAGSSIAYNTTSDHRLKENVVAISDGITRLKTLKPSRFNFKSEPSITMDGFIAHEVTAVPEAIEGEKDAVITQAMLDAGTLEGTVGDPIYQGIDQSKLVPLLTAALQEAVAKIETLETKVAALEGS